MTPQERSQLIDALLENQISESDFLRLEAELSVDPLARQDYYHRLSLSILLETEAANHPPSTIPSKKTLSLHHWFAAAAIIFILINAAIFLFPSQNPPMNPSPQEQRASGFAVLARQESAIWAFSHPVADGALLPSGPLQLQSGVVQLELFSGVTVLVEGPATFEIISPMEMNVVLGRFRAHVPEPAIGFRLHTQAGEIVDLGTEFGIHVTPDQTELHVLNGQVQWHPRNHPFSILQEGEGFRTTPDGRIDELSADSSGFVSDTQFQNQLDRSRSSKHSHWTQFLQTLLNDPRLLAYYQLKTPFNWRKQLDNQALTSLSKIGEASIVAAKPTPDRWGIPDGALDFSPAGSRVRLSIPGQHQALTLLCWVKINSLDRWYNSLFLTDGHDLHEPHWQIMDDGRLFFSVKKNDVWDSNKGEKDKHIFFSPPFWDSSLSGQWLMLATTYDVDSKLVTHYLNGRILSRESIPTEYLVETIHIGNASLGNWGLPERDEPRFAVRNLNGSMSDFALFQAALSEAEIKAIFDNGNP